MVSPGLMTFGEGFDALKVCDAIFTILLPLDDMRLQSMRCCGSIGGHCAGQCAIDVPFNERSVCGSTCNQCAVR